MEGTLLGAPPPRCPKRSLLLSVIGLLTLLALALALRPLPALRGSTEAECYAASGQRMRLAVLEAPPGACAVPPDFCRGGDDKRLGRSKVRLQLICSMSMILNGMCFMTCSISYHII